MVGLVLRLLGWTLIVMLLPIAVGAMIGGMELLVLIAVWALGVAFIVTRYSRSRTRTRAV